MNNEIIQQTERMPIAARTPGEVLVYAMDKGADMAQIEKLLDLQMKWEANEARKAFVADMAEFKKVPVTISKDKFVSFPTGKGSTSYHHATLGNVTATIVDALAKHGFSHRWETDQQQGGLIVVTCVLTHRLGHSERTFLSASRDESGSKNNIQAMGSTITYLQRYTLLAATGLATHDQDDDGVTSGETVPLVDKWIGKANAAPSLTDLNNVWNAGVKEIEAAEDRDAYEQFKAACNTRKAEIEANKAPRNGSSRVNNIVRGAAKPQAAE